MPPWRHFNPQKTHRQSPTDFADGLKAVRMHGFLHSALRVFVIHCKPRGVGALRMRRLRVRPRRLAARPPNNLHKEAAMELTTQSAEQAVKQMLLNMGADACGIANIDRFTSCAKGFHPTDIYPACRSVVVFLKRLPWGMLMADPRIVYRQAVVFTNLELDRIALAASLAMEQFGGEAVAVPSEMPYLYWDPELMEARGVISLRRAAVFAGLGQAGKNLILISPQLGTMVNIGAILTNLDLRSDPYAVNLCIPECRLCIDSCPPRALDGGRLDAKKCRSYSIGYTPGGFEACTCNRCRTVCPVALGE